MNDCLACSGCITSAESVLIGHQSHAEFLKLCSEIKTSSEMRLFDNVVVGLSSQPILSFAAKFNVTPNDARAKLSSKVCVFICIIKLFIKFFCVKALFRQLGAIKVFDVEAFSDLCLLECGRDFVQRFREKSAQPSSTPVLASACPGITL